MLFHNALGSCHTYKSYPPQHYIKEIEKYMLFTATMPSPQKKAEADLNHNRDTKKGAEKLIKSL